MTLPKTIRMAGVPLKIVCRDLSEDGTFGHYSHTRKLIVVDKSLAPIVLRDTIRHEMMHAAFAFSGLSYCEHWEEEAVVRCMEEVFFPSWERFLKRFKMN